MTFSVAPMFGPSSNVERDIVPASVGPCTAPPPNHVVSGVSAPM